MNCRLDRPTAVIIPKSVQKRSEHWVRQGREEGAELADHAQPQHEHRAILDHAAAAHLRNSQNANVGTG